MTNDLWKIGLLTIIVPVVYWQVWRQRSPTAKKRHLLISLIGFLMCFVIFAGYLLPQPLPALLIIPSITGVVLAVVFMRKFRKS